MLATVQYFCSVVVLNRLCDWTVLKLRAANGFLMSTLQAHSEAAAHAADALNLQLIAISAK